MAPALFAKAHRRRQQIKKKKPLPNSRGFRLDGLDLCADVVEAFPQTRLVASLAAEDDFGHDGASVRSQNFCKVVGQVDDLRFALAGIKLIY